MSTVRPIIIKKIKKIEGGHHGGAWKVAYAAFVTAMMAFFLLMWLLNATTEEQRSGLADYFDPKIPISQTSSGGMGMFKGDSVFAQDKLARSGLGGSGKQASAGRENNERHEVAFSEEDVWSPMQKEKPVSGSQKNAYNYDIVGFTKDKSQTSIINKDKITTQEIKQKISRSLKAINMGDLQKHLNFKMTDEGLRVDITDMDNKPMFLSGSDKPSQKMQKIMAIVGNVFSEIVNDIAITGHTDSKPLLNRRNYSNWELSSDRAHAARRILMDTGIRPSRIKRIEGRADRDPLFKSKPEDSKNRRISITLLNNLHKNKPKKVVKKNQEKVIKKSVYDTLLAPQIISDDKSIKEQPLQENQPIVQDSIPDPLAL